MRLHAPRLREADRGPHVPAGHDAGQPHRLAGQLRQRGAVHPRRRAADGDRGAAACPVDPHDPLRALPHRQRVAVPRRHGAPARRPHAALLRLPRPGVRAQPDRGGHRRALPPELRPHRRPQGRPAQGLDRRDPSGHEAAARASATRWTSSSSGNEIFQARTRGIGVIPTEVALSYGLSGANIRAQRRRLGPAPRPAAPASPGTSSTGRCGPTPTATASPATGCASRRSARHPDRRPAARRPARRADHGQGAAHHQGARGRGLGQHREPARRDGLLRRLQGRHRAVPGEDPLRRRSTTSRSCRGCSGASTSPTSSRSWPASTSSSATSTGEGDAVRLHRSGVLAGVDRCGSSASSSRSCCRRARSSTSSSSR